MFKRLRVTDALPKIGPDPGNISISQLIGDAHLPVTIKALNSLPENPKLRLYRTLIPIQILAEFDINLRTWKNADKQPQVNLVAEPCNLTPGSTLPQKIISTVFLPTKLESMENLRKGQNITGA